MNKEFISIVIKRFVKAFVSGGLASLSVATVQQPTLATLEDLKTWLVALGVAFLAGGILSIEKALQGYNPQ